MRLVETIIQPRGKYRISEASENSPLPKGAIAEITFDEIQVGDKSNGNGRVYPWKTLRSANERLLGALKEEALPSFDGHPKDTSEMLLSRIPAVLKDFRVDEDTGSIRDATFYLANNEAGRNALPLLQLGMVVGTSSRGNGSLKEGVFEGRHGKIQGHIVQEDLVLEGYDLVLKPSVVTARASGLREDQQEGSPMTVNDKLLKDLKDLAELKSLKPDIYRNLMTEALAACEGKLKEKIEVFEAEIRVDIQDEIEKPLKEQISKLEKDLAESKKQVSESKEKTQKLTESATANEKALQGQIGELQRTLNEQREKHSSDLAKVNESVQAMQLRENMALAKAHVISATEGQASMDKHVADVLRASVLGTDPNKGGVQVSESLTKAYANVKPPVSVQEAKDRLNMAMTLLTSAGISTEKGHRSKGDDNINESQTAAEDRLTVLSYGGRSR